MTDRRSGWLPRVWWLGLVLSLGAFLLADHRVGAETCGSAPGDRIADVLSGLERHGAGRPVRMRAVITGAFPTSERLGGFFLQQGEGTQARGLFVYAPELTPADVERLRPGTEVEVLGRTGLWRAQPQIEQVDTIRVCGRPGLPDPAVVAVPWTEADLAAHSGLLVRFQRPLTVTGSHELGLYGSLHLAPERLFRSGSGSMLVLDDGSYRRWPDRTDYLDPGTGTRRIGDRVPELVGVLVHQFDAWRLHPLAVPAFEQANPRPEAQLPPPDGGIRVAAFNVQNYFVSLRQRGARSDEEAGWQRDKLVAALAGLDADLLGLIELENRPGVSDRLRAALAAGGSPWALAEGAGSAGDDAIRVDWLYRSDRLVQLGPAERDTDPAHRRPPVLARFRPLAGGQPFLAALVHFKSKTGCPERGDIDRGEGCWNQLRLEQADALIRSLRARQQRHAVSDLLLLGDFNSDRHEQPMRRLAEAGFVDAIAGDRSSGRDYSYVFQGRSTLLDHVLVNAAASQRVIAAGTWPINADEPRLLGYRSPHPAAAGNRRGPYRSSDHDPVFVDLAPGSGSGSVSLSRSAE